MRGSKGHGRRGTAGAHDALGLWVVLCLAAQIADSFLYLGKGGSSSQQLRPAIQAGCLSIQVRLLEVSQPDVPRCFQEGEPPPGADLLSGMLPISNQGFSGRCAPGHRRDQPPQSRASLHQFGGIGNKNSLNRARNAIVAPVTTLPCNNRSNNRLSFTCCWIASPPGRLSRRTNTRAGMQLARRRTRHC